MFSNHHNTSQLFAKRMKNDDFALSCHVFPWRRTRVEHFNTTQNGLHTSIRNPTIPDITFAWRLLFISFPPSPHSTIRLDSLSFFYREMFINEGN